MLLEYDKDFENRKFISTIKTALPNIRQTSKKYIRLLLPIGALRAISTAIVQKMLEIGVDFFQRTTTNAIIIIVISFAGAIAGHILSVFFTKQRRLIAMIFTIVLGLTTIYFPYIIDTYEYFTTLNIF
jgi:putative Mn2+ efflux pump MntP